MDLADVQAMIKRGADSEWTTLELKKGLAEKDAGIKTLSAFLNHGGGTVIFGVTPNGKIGGIPLRDQGLRNLADLFRAIEPAVEIRQEIVDLPDTDGLGLLLVSASPIAGEGPYTFQGRAYIRNGSRTDRMPQNLYEQRLAARDNPRQRWESQPAVGVSLADLDGAEILRTARLGVESGRVPADALDDTANELLQRMHLLDGETPLNAAVALFGGADPVRFPQMRLHMAHFAGGDKDSAMLDLPAPVTGNVFTVLREAEAFLRRRLPLAGRVVAGAFERVDEPVFPTKALREVLANAVAHRDYGHAGGAVHVAIYTDRVEVTNPGSLPAGLSVEDLFKVHESKPRNPLIADVLFYRKLIDEWGRGTRSVVQLCERAGHPAPEFFLRGGSFGVCLWSSVPLGPQPAAFPELKPGEIAVLRALEGGDASVKQLYETLEAAMPIATVRTYLANLRRAGLVENEGRRGPGAKWKIRAEGLQFLTEAPRRQ